MANTRIPMRKIKEVLRLRYECRLSHTRIATALGMSSATVHEYLTRAKGAGLSWPLPDGIDDDALEQKLFPPPAGSPPPGHALPDWNYIHKELRRKGVTLSLLWEEYKAENPEGYQYSQFCELYRRFAKRIDVTMRQVHKAGEKLFVDYAGPTIPVVDPNTGEIRNAQLFIAVLGASNYTYAEATWSQGSYDWLSSHARAFAYIGGVPALVVPDNLKSGVTKPSRYEPELNTSYLELATHYGTAILPARARKPRDKAKVENGVLVVERWILAALRNRTFFSLGELNTAIRQLLERLNTRPFKKMDGCRRSVFESLEKQALKPLPQTRFEVAEWKKARVNLDYHVELDHHYYSVPYVLAHQEVELRFTPMTVEIFSRGKRVASHARSYQRGRHTTVAEHMPKSHQRYAGWTPSKIKAQAERIGPETARLAETIIQKRPHPEQGYRSCLGLMRLAKEHGPERLEAACARALAIGAHSYTSVRAILKNGLERLPLPETPISSAPILHPNIRGASYYKETDNVEPSHGGKAECPETLGHGQGSQRADGQPIDLGA